MSSKSKPKAAILARVSTDSQSVEMQLDEAREYCSRKGLEIAKEYTETISGATETHKRPVMTQLLEDASKGKFKVLVIYRLDRLGRSVKDVLEIVSTLCEGEGVKLVSLYESLDTDSPLGRFTLTILSALNQLSREMIVSRVKSGIQSYRKKHGGRWGRQKKEWDTAKAQRLFEQQWSLRAIARECGVSLGLVWGYFQEKEPVHNSPSKKAS